MSRKTYVLYHKMCMDGFGGAYSAWKSLGENAEYIPVGYGDKVPDLDGDSLVYMIDVSFKRDVLIEICKNVKKLIVLDHHKSAENDLVGLDKEVNNLVCIFNMKKSGAMLAWEYFHPETKVPYFIRYIQDRDLWLHKLKDTHEIHLGMFTLPFDFKVWDEKLPKKLAIKKSGEAISAYQKKTIGELESHIVMVEFEGYKNIPCVNTPVLASDIGDTMNKKFTEAPFSLSYFIKNDGKVKWSIRAIGTGTFNAIPLAEKHGGGGHPKACGFISNIDLLVKILSTKGN